MTLTVDRIQGLSGSLAIKRPVACATTANITLNGLQTIDGFVLASGDRVLVKNQTTGSENGVYEADTSDWRRTLDFDKSNDVVEGTLVNVIGGSTNYGLWILSTTSPVVGTSSLAFERFEGFEGSDQVVYVPAGAGAVPTTAQEKLRESVSPKDKGAVGDGVTDDLAALKLALESGYPVDGGGLTYAISGTCTPTSFKGLFNANLVQIGDNSGTNFTTLNIVGISDFFIENVNINMGVNVTTLENDNGNNGLYIGGSNETTFIENFNIRNVQVTGNGCGAGINVRHSKRFVIDGCIVHDRVAGSSPDPSNDCQNGIQVVNCANFTLSNSHAYNLKARVSGVDSVRFSRGFVFTEIRDCAIVGCTSTSVNQGYDFSGAYVASPLYIGNRRWTISGCTANDCNTYGFKFANVTREGLVTGCIANNIGNIGFVFSPSALDITGLEKYNTQNIDVVGCKVVNTLGSGEAGTTSQGFRVMKNALYATYPRGIRLKDCSVIDTQDPPTTATAYASDVSLSTLPGEDIANVAIGCTYLGVTTSGFTTAIGHPICVATGTTNQSIPNTTWTEVVWDNSLIDTNDLHSTTTDNENIYVRTSGWYEVKVQADFDPVASGQYRCKLLKNGSDLNRTTVSAQAATTAGPVTLITSIIVYADAGDYFSVKVYQSTGGAVDLNVNESHFSAKLL